MSPAVMSAGPRTSRRSTIVVVAGRGEHDVLEVQDDVGDVLGDTGDGVELVQCVVEAHRGDGRAGDRRQQRAAQRVADGVAEAGLERADGEALTIVVFVADGFDGGALNDEHGCAFGLRGGLPNYLE